MDFDEEEEEEEDGDDEADVSAKKGNRVRVSLYPDMLPKVIAKDSPSVEEVEERCDA